MGFEELILLAGHGVETLGVLAILLGAGWAGLRAAGGGSGAVDETRYRAFRRDFGRSMMLGLDFLVAGDIIRTVVVAESFESVASLGLLVVIRTILVFTIHLDVEGRWPWATH
jgi:uncharacterized membrane protein